MFKQGFTSPMGEMTVTADDKNILSVKFNQCKEENKSDLTQRAITQLGEYFKGIRKFFELPFEIIGTEFQRKVLDAVMHIPFGKTASYSEIATSIGREDSYRAVGTAVGRNNLLIIVPCHRIICENGKLSRYAGGAYKKDKLLTLEHSLD